MVDLNNLTNDYFRNECGNVIELFDYNIYCRPRPYSIY